MNMDYDEKELGNEDYSSYCDMESGLNEKPAISQSASSSSKDDLNPEDDNLTDSSKPFPSISLEMESEEVLMKDEEERTYSPPVTILSPSEEEMNRGLPMCDPVPSTSGLCTRKQSQEDYDTTESAKIVSSDGNGDKRCDNDEDDDDDDDDFLDDGVFAIKYDRVKDSRFLSWLKEDSTKKSAPHQISCASSAENEEAQNSHKDRLAQLKKLYEEILERRKKEEEIEKKLDELLKKGYLSDERRRVESRPAAEDEDIKFMKKSTEANKVERPTLSVHPDYTSFHPELSCRFFNHETLNISKFVVLHIPLHLPAVFSDKFADMMTMDALQTLECSAEEEEGMCTFFFYLMSVHPHLAVAESCLGFLNRKKHFCPSVTDIINVIRNWGVQLSEMYQTVPDQYIGLHTGLEDPPEARMQVQDHNFSLFFNYMKTIVQVHSPETYVFSLEPLMRFVLDKNIYQKCVTLDVTDIIKSLAREDIPLKKLHLKDLSLQNQTVLHTLILRHLPCSSVLAYATIQQFLGKNDLTYKLPVDFEAVCEFCTSKNDEISNSTFQDFSCYVKLIEAILFQKRIDGGKVLDNPIKKMEWISLLHPWQESIQVSFSNADPIFLKGQISQILYELRMKVALEMRNCVFKLL